jgi:hypothetical protein
MLPHISSVFGFFCTALLLFSAILAWQLGALSAGALSELKPVRWAFAVCFASLTVITWHWVFPAPTVFSALVALTLVLAARARAAS